METAMERIQEKVDEVALVVNKIDKELALQKAAFDDHLKQDERMYEEFKRMNDILFQNTESLKEHIHRTDIAEQQLETLKELVERIDTRLVPIEQEKIEQNAIKQYRNHKIVEVAKIVGAISALVAMVAAIKSLF